ncbi:MAG TPA: ATP-binding cassette domain-containing protein, partial [Streptosporangiaceae bacterium]
EQQRVAIARALVNHPSMLMCDEPTGNLDTATTLELTDLLDSLRREGTTLVVITHNPVVASRAQRKFAIRDGALTDPAEQGAQAEQHEIRNGTLTEPTEPLAEHGDADAWPDR